MIVVSALLGQRRRRRRRKEAQRGANETHRLWKKTPSMGT